MTTDLRKVAVAGYSTRAIAESAALAGFDVTAIDAFADLDQHPLVKAKAISPFTPMDAARAAQSLSCDAVAYLSSFENHPDAVAALACGRALWGNAPDVLRQVRNPHQLAAAVSRHQLPAPLLDGRGDGPWLLKPLASGGGVRIQYWREGTAVPEAFYLQQFVEGEAGSIAFVASHGEVRVLGLFSQLIGMAAFGASGFRYCGSILQGGNAGAGLMHQAQVLARAVTTEFNLTGLTGIDFIRSGDDIIPIEVNPRWSASMELVERAYGISMFAIHADACRASRLPEFDAITAAPVGRTIGKAVVFARQHFKTGDTGSWCADPSVRDVPRPATLIHAGEPVCTVFADGATPAACRQALEDRAARVYDTLNEWARAS